MVGSIGIIIFNNIMRLIFGNNILRNFEILGESIVLEKLLVEIREKMYGYGVFLVIIFLESVSDGYDVNLEINCLVIIVLFFLYFDDGIGEFVI